VPRTIIGLASLDIRAGADLASKDHGTTPYRGASPQQDHGDALCDCLPFACSTSLTEMRGTTKALVASDVRFHHETTCSSCRRTVLALAYKARR